MLNTISHHQSATQLTGLLHDGDPISSSERTVYHHHFARDGQTSRSSARVSHSTAPTI